MDDQKTIKILYGTMTGTAEELADELAGKLGRIGYATEVEDAGGYDVANLKHEKRVAVVISTWGEGEPPDDAEDFCFDLFDGKVGELPDLEFAVCALGDTSYQDFCGCGRRVDEALDKAGACKLIDRVDLDCDYEDDFKAWAEKLAERLEAVQLS
jgi:sulfite reductase (NADPH) flavoprotein alpha-component